MALFGDKKKASAKVAKKKAIGVKERSERAAQNPNAYKILVKPRITEKAHTVLGLNKYVFQVASDATKVSVKKAIEEVYGVSVNSVNTITVPRKKRNFGRSGGFKSSFKKAIVTLKQGETIELFQTESEA